MKGKAKAKAKGQNINGKEKHSVTSSAHGKGKEKDKSPVPQQAEKRPSDPWQVDRWTFKTAKEAYEKLKEDPEYQKRLSTRQLKAKFEKLGALFEDGSHLVERDKLVRAKEFLKALPQDGYPCPINIGEAQKHGDEEVKRQEEVETVLINMGKEFTPQQTKRMVILREYGKSRGTHRLAKEGSTVTRITESFGEKDAENAIAAMQADLNHYLVRVRTRREKMFFYGTSEGQRMHVQAAKWAESNNGSAHGLEKSVTIEMQPNEKESWKEVSNYWLAGSADTQLGMVGERLHGLGEHQGRDYFEECLKEELKRRGDDNPYVNLGGDLPQEERGKKAKSKEKTNLKMQRKEADGERALFLYNFREAQNILGKDWKEDVKRLNYQDKPGKKSESGAASGPANEGVLDTKPEYYDDLICRRMCKWILHLASYNKQTVIYSLDTIDLGASVEAKLMEIPDNVSDTGMKLKIPVCTSELREAFRYIDKLTNVEFYQALLPVDKPWGSTRAEEIQKSWAEYAMHLTRKMLLLYPGDNLCLQKAEEMLAAWDRKDWSAVIACYAAIKPSELLTPVFPVTKQQLNNHNERIEQMENIKRSMSRETAEKYRNTALAIQHQLRVSVIPNPSCDSGSASAPGPARAANSCFFPPSQSVPRADGLDHSQSQKDALLKSPPAVTM